jgi:hypothetical protein
MNLRDYVNSKISDSAQFYNESFCSLVFDYIGITGGLTNEDITFLKENDYTAEDFND